MAAGVVAVIADFVMTMGLDIVKKNQILPTLIMVAAFIATVWFDVNVILVILVSGLVGGLHTLWCSKYSKKEEKK